MTVTIYATHEGLVSRASPGSWRGQNDRYLCWMLRTSRLSRSTPITRGLPKRSFRRHGSSGLLRISARNDVRRGVRTVCPPERRPKRKLRYTGSALQNSPRQQITSWLPISPGLRRFETRQVGPRPDRPDMHEARRLFRRRARQHQHASARHSARSALSRQIRQFAVPAWRSALNSARAASSASGAEPNWRPSRLSNIRSDEKKLKPRSSPVTIPAVRLLTSMM